LLAVEARVADRYALHTVADLIIKQPPLRIATGYNDGINVIGYAVEKVLNAYGATWDSLEQWGGKWFVADTQLPPLTWFATGEVDALFHETAEGDKVLLDEILGNGFSSLALTAQPYLLFAAVTQPIWDCLQVHRVAVLPQHAAWYVAPPEIIVVRAQDQTLTKIAAGYAGIFSCCARIIVSRRLFQLPVSRREATLSLTFYRKPGYRPAW